MSETLADLEAKAWKLGASGDTAAIARFSSQSEIHAMIMSGRFKINGRPKSKSGVPLFPFPTHKHNG